MKAILVLTSTNPFFEEELKSLCEACHIEVIDVVIQKLEKINPATYIGKGKIEEIKLKLQDEMVIFDDELTPLQVKNLTDLLETEVTDRTDLILRIFDERAKTKEAKLQVEIARDQYLLPRLVGMQEHMSHQQGGSGFRGSGEKQIELDRRIIARKLARSRKELAEIVKQRQVQRQRRKNNQIPVIALVGYTNSGKSTLLNVLLNEDKAIVSDIHGTTRDVIEDTISIGGVTFRFIDTAGIRETNDKIESLGIERTFQKLEQAEIVLWMVDSVNAASQIEQLSKKIIPRCEGKHLIVVFNKADLIEDVQKSNLSALLENFPQESTEHIYISAKRRENTNELQKMLINAAHLPTVTQNDVIVTNVRHYEALSKALDAIHRVQNGLDSHLSGDFLSQDIRECIFFISDIAGEVTNDMVLQNIFQHFCIGK